MNVQLTTKMSVRNDTQTKIPNSLLWTVVATSVLPFLLNMLGLDFGNDRLQPTDAVMPPYNHKGAVDFFGKPYDLTSPVRR